MSTPTTDERARVARLPVPAEPKRLPGRPRVGTWKRLLILPDDMLALVERYRAREGLSKMRDAIRALIRAGLWSEGYDEAEHVRAVFAAGEGGAAGDGTAPDDEDDETEG